MDLTWSWSTIISNPKIQLATSEASSVPSSPTAGSPVQEDSALGVHADRAERLPGLPASQMEPLLSNLLPNGNAPARSALASTSATVFDNDKESLLKAEYLKGIREMATQMTCTCICS